MRRGGRRRGRRRRGGEGGSHALWVGESLGGRGVGGGEVGGVELLLQAARGAERAGGGRDSSCPGSFLAAAHHASPRVVKSHERARQKQKFSKYIPAFNKFSIVFLVLVVQFHPSIFYLNFCLFGKKIHHVFIASKPGPGSTLVRQAKLVYFCRKSKLCADTPTNTHSLTH